MFRELESFCTDQGVTIQECIVAWIESGLPDDQDTSTDDADREKQQKKQTSDGKPASEEGAADPDNGQDGRRKERAAAQLTPMTVLERMELNGKQQALVAQGRITEASQIRKLMDAHDAAVRTQNAPALTEARSRLVEVMTAAGTRHFNQLH